VTAGTFDSPPDVLLRLLAEAIAPLGEVQANLPI
jgi:hypothetical protein